MAIPVYVVTGFLDAGKTTFLDNLLNRRDWQNVKILVIQFESGEEEFYSSYHNCESITFPKRDLEMLPNQIVRQISSFIYSHVIDEIWIEWNGVAPFTKLEALLLHSSLRNLCKTQKVIHIADAAGIENLLGRTGSALPEQIANSDFIVLRNVPSAAAYKRLARRMNGINPGVALCNINNYRGLYKQLFEKKEHPVRLFFLVSALIFFLCLIGGLLSDTLQFPVNTIITVFLGIILQAVPFLLIGVLLSSAIQVFIPQSLIERRFPKSIGLGMLAAIAGGFCLPVCDCASIPIFRSLVRKGIPLPVAITFMTVTPVINPVVILSTYYAFNGSLTIVIGRVCFGIAASVITGLIFAIRPPKEPIFIGGGVDGLMCSCGSYQDAGSIAGWRGKLGLLIRHSQAEFFSVGKYLLIGTFIASVFQVLGTGKFTSAQHGAGLAVSIVIMMAMAFVLSLCSSSDAVIARSFIKQFPIGGIMGFLVFGPMMDIKNVLMLSSGFTKRFIGELLFATFIVCFSVIFLFSGFGVI